MNLRQFSELWVSKIAPLTILTFDPSQGFTHYYLALVCEYDDLRLYINGWFCRDGELVERAPPDCGHGLLTSLFAGNDPKVGKLFAQDVLHRASAVSATDY